MNQVRTVRLPVHVIREINQVLRATRFLEKALGAQGRAPDLEEIASLTGKLRLKPSLRPLRLQQLRRFAPNSNSKHSMPLVHNKTLILCKTNFAQTVATRVNPPQSQSISRVTCLLRLSKTS
jgi:hypothetical protein